MQSSNQQQHLPKVSVVIPYYNREQYIDQCLESVFNQDYSNLEIILVNDASTPESRNYLNKYQDTIQIVDIQKNSGAAAARNTGIERATGEYIAFLDSDDYWERQKLTIQIHYLLENPHVTGCHTGISTFNEHGIIKHYLNKPAILSKTEVIKRGHALPSSFVIKRSALLAVNLFDTRIKIAEDHDLLIRLVAQNYRIDFIAEPLTKMRRAAHSHLSTNFWGAVFGHFKMTLKNRELFKEIEPDTPIRVHLSRYLYNDSWKAKPYFRPFIKSISYLLKIGYTR